MKIVRIWPLSLSPDLVEAVIYMATRATALRHVMLGTCNFQPHSLISSFAL
jgi:hypothetical protein